MNPWQYKFYFWNMLYRMSHGFDITHELLVMDWHFKDILCLVVLLFYRSNTFPIDVKCRWKDTFRDEYTSAFNIDNIQRVNSILTETLTKMASTTQNIIDDLYVNF